MTTDEKHDHRWFAVECNNQAWELWEKPVPTPAETERMLDLAHAARWHWSQIGTASNEVRALTLLAYVYTNAELPERGLHYAQLALRLADSPGTEVTRFDRACIQAALARAYDALGNEAVWQHRYAAEQIAEEIAEENDRQYFLKSLLHFTIWNTVK